MGGSWVRKARMIAIVSRPALYDGGVARRTLLVCFIAIAVGCTHAPTPDPPLFETSQATMPSGSCHARLPFPDPNCTPGVVNPDVTQENIAQTICVPGYTKTIRPPSSYTSSLKVRQIVEYGYGDTNPADYEEDHFIPLELGGHPTNPRNLWPEPHAATDGSSAKDKVENALHALVCSGQLTLEEAQRRVTSDWTHALP
jgi:hypothetical protein